MLTGFVLDDVIDASSYSLALGDFAKRFSSSIFESADEVSGFVLGHVTETVSISLLAEEIASFVLGEVIETVSISLLADEIASFVLDEVVERFSVSLFVADGETTRSVCFVPGDERSSLFIDDVIEISSHSLALDDVIRRSSLFVLLRSWGKI
jgi:hypothetical protein